MIALLAAVGAITIAVLLWRAFGAQRIGVPDRRPTLAPDDDPDFLRKLGEQQRKRPTDDPDA
ncbi:hypothetical protein AB0F91_14575 [Amycolatopsis sp. NPDC023774]|uniref:Uncharacterized protein n=1 Tax=Amycolatopsis carbonis TaxID=715471 RepID=A0A9Y2IJ57_9PSEU|nr:MULTISPECIES: hypothetical protein [unclassified Amycolatopsis]QYN24732.1 hypothetical protein K1T34_21215 [Amycolatopsis sp. DSM 110486]WIX80130.1 hypothetical protein QRX50_04895 [Amycolatopsis sp. 2-15]